MEDISNLTNKNGKYFQLIYAYMNISLRIKELRKKNNISQKEFALSIGIDDSQLSKIERGILQPTLNQIMEISSIYKTSTDWLLLGKQNEPVSNSNIDFKELAEARLQIIEMKDEKISRLEKDLSEFRYNAQKEPVLYRTVAEPSLKLSKKQPK